MVGRTCREVVARREGEVWVVGVGEMRHCLAGGVRRSGIVFGSLGAGGGGGGSGGLLEELAGVGGLVARWWGSGSWDWPWLGLPKQSQGALPSRIWSMRLRKACGRSPPEEPQLHV